MKEGCVRMRVSVCATACESLTYKNTEENRVNIVALTNFVPE